MSAPIHSPRRVQLVPALADIKGTCTQSRAVRRVEIAFGMRPWTILACPKQIGASGVPAILRRHTMTVVGSSTPAGGFPLNPAPRTPVAASLYFHRAHPKWVIPCRKSDWSLGGLFECQPARLRPEYATQSRQPASPARAIKAKRRS